MTLPPFEIHRPSLVDEATALLNKYGDDAALYCGGSELLLLMKLGFADYGHLICVKGIEDLHGLQVREGGLRIGAATTHRQIERSVEVRSQWPALASLERNVANIRVRTVGSLGGNLCFADPHSDPTTFLLAANAELQAQQGSASRSIPMKDFLRGPYQTALRQGEILTSIEIPAAAAQAAFVHKKFAFRERPAATLTCMVRVENKMVTEVRISVGSVGPVPVRSEEAEMVLVGQVAKEPNLKAIEQAGEVAAEASGATEDLNGAPDYKRNLVRVLVKRCFLEAVNEAGS